jgi:hypothetical protein
MNLLFFFKMISEFSFYFIPANYLASLGAEASLWFCA